MTKDMKALKELLALDRETLEKMFPKPFKPSSLDVIVSMHAPHLYSAENLAEINKFSEAILSHSAASQYQDSVKKMTKKKRSPRKPVTLAPKKDKIIKDNKEMDEKKMMRRKKKNEALFAGPPPELADELRKKVMELNGTDLVYVMRKKIYGTDLNKGNDRLSMPETQIYGMGSFFTEGEKKELLVKDEDDEKPIGIEVVVLDLKLEEHTLKLKKWKMTSSSTYNLTSQWKKLAHSNSLKLNDVLLVWSFLVQDKRYFMLHKL